MDEGINGTLYAHLETGTEGMIWVLQADELTGYKALKMIEDGDYLTVFENDGGVVFSNYIQKDTETGKRPHPFNPSYKQQAALGVWVHWIQSGWSPDDWAKLFVNELRAVLYKCEKK